MALFIALGGASYAATQLPKNSVGTRQLKKNSVTAAKIRNGAVTGQKIELSSLGTAPNANHATRAHHATTAAPTGTAGGDLIGSYPSPTIGNGKVTSSKVAANAIGAGALGTITKRSAVCESVLGESFGLVTVQCDTGEQVLGGGFEFPTSGMEVIVSRLEPPNGWRLVFLNQTGSLANAGVDAYCLQP